MSEQFVEKLTTIQRSPLQLRRMKASWPWYCTLDKCLKTLTPEQVQVIKQQFPIVSIGSVEPGT